MPKYVPITRERHAAKRWKPYSGFAFAAQEAVASVELVEVPAAVMSLPLAFLERGEGFVLAAVLGLQNGRNLFVAPDGRWIGGYIPALIRGYPFRLASAGDSGRKILCIDEDSGLLTDGPEGEAFFSEDGQPLQTMTDILNQFLQMDKNGVLTANACMALVKHKLICPWPVTYETAGGGKQGIKGLFKIDEAALNALSGDALLALRQAGALLLAYGQLLSMQHMPRLSILADAHAKLAAKAAPAKPAGLPVSATGELDLEFLKRSETLSFGNLG